MNRAIIFFLSIVVLCIVIDLWSLSVVIRRVKKGRGPSAVPFLTLFLYLVMFTRASGWREWLLWLPGFGFLIVLHGLCNFVLPAIYGGWFNGRTPLHRAVIRRRLERARVLLDNGANANARDNRGWTPLHIAARSGNLEITRLLVASGANLQAIADDRYSILYESICGGQEEIVALLLGNGVEPSKDEIALLCAAGQGHLSILKRVLATGIDLTGEIGTKLVREAVLHSQKETAEYLLQNGAYLDINSRNSQGTTLLHWIMRVGMCRDRRAMAELLISLGADINAKDSYGITPLADAVRMRCREVEALLREHGAQE